jgi:heme-degrading monooxygenase HmoA
MYARVVYAYTLLTLLDDAIDLCRALEVTWHQQQGFQGANLLIDRFTGKIMIISMWATRADLEASEASGWYHEQVAKFARTWTSPPVREIFEIPVQIGAARAVGES